LRQGRVAERKKTARDGRTAGGASNQPGCFGWRPAPNFRMPKPTRAGRASGSQEWPQEAGADVFSLDLPLVKILAPAVGGRMQTLCCTGRDSTVTPCTPCAPKSWTCLSLSGSSARKTAGTQSRASNAEWPRLSFRDGRQMPRKGRIRAVRAGTESPPARLTFSCQARFFCVALSKYHDSRTAGRTAEFMLLVVGPGLLSGDLAMSFQTGNSGKPKEWNITSRIGVPQSRQHILSLPDSKTGCSGERGE
jgi:hypothetical protein